jgi:hypothetical protein
MHGLAFGVPGIEYPLMAGVAKRFLWWGMPRQAGEVPENVPANRGKSLLQRTDMFSGVGMTRWVWEVAPDAGAMPRTACTLVISKGSGQPRQRRWSWR